MALFNTLQNEDLIFNFNFLKYVLYLNLYGAGFDNIFLNNSCQVCF